MKNFHALFIGIDAYQKVTSLNGCVNDALMMFEYLKEAIFAEKYNFQPSFLLSIHDHKVVDYNKRFEQYGISYEVNAANNLPTRSNILQTLKLYQSTVAAGDVFFLFYAGHGSTEAAHPYFKEPTGDLQTLVPRDSRTMLTIKDKTGHLKRKKVKDILDKEIRFLLHKIWCKGNNENAVEIIFIQDSCHSAGATRNVLEENLSKIESIILGETTVNDTSPPLEKDKNLNEQLADFSAFLEDEEEEIVEEHNLISEAPSTEGDRYTNEERLVAARMVIADTDASNYRPVEEFGFYDLLSEEEIVGVKAYENEGDRTNVFGEEEEGIARGLETGKEESLSSRAGTKGKNKKQPPFEVAYPEANHIHLSACGKAEYAYEIKYPSGQKGGVFTNTIITLLKEFGGNISYHDLFNAAKLRIDGAFRQSPSIYIKGNFAKQYEQFLGGFIEKREGIYNLVYKSNIHQWRADVGAFLGLPILKLNENIPVEVFLDSSPQKVYAAFITYVLAETAVVKFRGEAPKKEMIGLKLRVDPVYMTQAIPVAVEQDAAYKIRPTSLYNHFITDDEGEAAYRISPQANSIRLSLAHQPAEYVDISFYSFIQASDLPYEPEDLYVDYLNDGAYANYELWIQMQSMFSRMPELLAEWFKFEFADGSFFYFNGRHFFLVNQNIDITPFLVSESREIFTYCLNHFFEANRADAKVFINLHAHFKNPFQTHLNGLNLSVLERYIKWVNPEDADYLVRVRNGKYYITCAKQKDILLTKGTSGLAKNSVAKILGYLRSISRWQMLKSLHNPHPNSKEMLDNLEIQLETTIKGETVVLTLDYLEQERKFQWYKNGEVIQHLELDHQKMSDYEEGYLNTIEITRSGTIAQQTFFGALYLDYNFGIYPQEGIGSTEFFPYTEEKREKVLLDVHRLKKIPEIFNLPAQNRPNCVHTALKFFIAFNRFDVSDWLQEGVPIPASEDYHTEEIGAMRSKLGRKINPKAGDCVVLTLPIVLNIPEHQVPIPKDSNSNSIRGSFNA